MAVGMRRFGGDAVKPFYAVIGVVLLGSAGLIYLVMQPSLRNAQSSNCFSNLKQIGLATLIYTRDYDGQYPVATRWMDDLEPYVNIGEKERTPKDLDRSFRCATTGEFYVLNEFFAGANLSDDFDPTTSPLAFDARARASAISPTTAACGLLNRSIIWATSWYLPTLTSR